MVGEGFLTWVRDLFLESDSIAISSRIVAALVSEEELQVMFDSFTPEQQNNPATKALYDSTKAIMDTRKKELVDPLTGFISTTLDGWLKQIEGLEGTTPDTAQEKLSAISAKIVEIFAASAAIDVGLGMLPNSAGEASSMNTKELLKWLGFSAVLAAIAHDPVKIGLLRPWQDSLEQTFRNRRPSDVAIFQAYRTRELYSAAAAEILASEKYQAFAKVRDAAKGEVPLEPLPVPYAGEIEETNDAVLWRELSRNGYSDEYIASLSRSATITPRFNDLMQLARQGLIQTRDATPADGLPEGLQNKWEGKISDFALYSLWGAGYDKLTMGPILDSLMVTNRISNYGGFRSMIEPSYVSGEITEADLRAYWDKIGVPKDVQDWVLPRLTSKRVAYLAKEEKAAAEAGRELTRADTTTAYKLNILTLAETKSKLKAMEYSDEEIDLIIKIADAQKKPPAAEACKKLSLTDYEKAFENGILTKDQVLDRMRGEYCEADIAIEDEFLDLSALTAEAPAKEKDLSISQLTSTYNLGLITLEAFNIGLDKLGFDDEEKKILTELADIKKTLSGTGKLKRLALTDYEKLFKNGIMSIDDVLKRMEGEYTPEDIQLERLGLLAGVL